MEVIAFRLKPGADLKASIEAKARERNITAGCIISCVGGLRQACVRMAGATPDSQDIRTMTEAFEIVSLVGTVSVDGVHLHLSFSNRAGQVHGGHLKEGTLINPTAEIIIGVADNLHFKRELDTDTGFRELTIEEST